MLSRASVLSNCSVNKPLASFERQIPVAFSIHDRKPASDVSSHRYDSGQHLMSALVAIPNYHCQRCLVSVQPAQLLNFPNSGENPSFPLSKSTLFQESHTEPRAATLANRSSRATLPVAGGAPRFKSPKRSKGGLIFACTGD
jgi:hypothetical protein